MKLKRITLLLFFMSAFMSAACGVSDPKETPKPGPTPEYKTPVDLADPFILCYEGRYYAYGTSSDSGIKYFTSEDLYTWNPGGLALNKADVYADRWFWAPEVYYIPEKGKFYMYYSADEHICVATADKPEGPFKQDVMVPIREEKGIDNSLFRDDDGKAYLYFVRFNDGNNIWVAELDEDLKTIKEQTLTHCFSVSQPWEQMMGRVCEGPLVVKHNGTYFLTYSANDYQSQDYGVGFATSSSPMGPWTKFEGNPIMRRPGTLVGTGHHAIFTDKDGTLRIVFHSHYSAKTIHPRLMQIGKVTFSATGSKERMNISDCFTPSLKVK